MAWRRHLGRPTPKHAQRVSPLTTECSEHMRTAGATLEPWHPRSSPQRPERGSGPRDALSFHVNGGRRPASANGSGSQASTTRNPQARIPQNGAASSGAPRRSNAHRVPPLPPNVDPRGRVSLSPHAGACRGNDAGGAWPRPAESFHLHRASRRLGRQARSAVHARLGRPTPTSRTRAAAHPSKLRPKAGMPWLRPTTPPGSAEKGGGHPPCSIGCGPPDIENSTSTVPRIHETAAPARAPRTERTSAAAGDQKTPATSSGIARALAQALRANEAGGLRATVMPSRLSETRETPSSPAEAHPSIKPISQPQLEHGLCRPNSSSNRGPPGTRGGESPAPPK